MGLEVLALCHKKFQKPKFLCYLRVIFGKREVCFKL